METSSEVLAAKIRKLKIAIDGTWSAFDFAVLFKSIQSLYSLHVNYETGLHSLRMKEESNTHYVDQKHEALFHFINSRVLIRSFFSEEGIYADEEGGQIFINYGYPRTDLRVSSISYSSPGFTDFLGASGALGHIKELITHYFPNKEKQEEIKIKQQERIALQIDNLKKMGFSSTEIKRIILLEEIASEKILKLIKEGKITAIELTES